MAIKEAVEKLGDDDDDDDVTTTPSKSDVEPKEVEIDDDDDEGDEPEPKKTGEPAPQPVSRRERRANRYREQIQARELAEQRAAELERHNQLLQLQVEQTRAIQNLATAHAPPEKDPYKEKFDDIDRRRREVYAANQARSASGQLTEAEYNENQAKVFELNRQEQALVARREWESLQRQQPQQQQTNPAVIQFQLRYTDIAPNQQASRAAVLECQKLRALGYPDDWNTMDIAVNRVRQELGIKPAGRAPAANVRRAMTGAAAGGSGAGATKVTLDPHERQIARAMYPNLSKGEAEKKFAKRVKVGTSLDDDD